MPHDSIVNCTQLVSKENWTKTSQETFTRILLLPKKLMARLANAIVEIIENIK
jgi:hypothetical protein